MKNYKEMKGITLISLIITIVILIILAAITVSTIREDALLEKVEDAKDTAASSIEKDKTNLSEYENYIETNTGTKCSHPNGLNYEYEGCGGGSVTTGHWVVATCQLCGWSSERYYDESLQANGSYCEYCKWDVHGGWRPDDYWNTIYY